MRIQLLLIVSLLVLSFSAKSQDYDPWMKLNQHFFSVNDYFDQLLVRPIALTYTNVTPRFFQVGVGNVFDNLQDVNVAINDFLQFKIEDGLSDSGRIIVNSTIGIGGILDVATSMGLYRNEEDFGQTLGVWGVPTGPYLMLPFYGPSSPRDLVGRPISGVLSGTFSIEAVSYTHLTLPTKA